MTPRTLTITVALLTFPATTTAQEAGPGGADGGVFPRRFVAAVGVSFASFPDAAPLSDPELTTTAAEVRSSGFDLALAGEVIVLPWLRAGAAYQRHAGIERSQAFDVDGFRGFTTELVDGSFDPRLVALYAMPVWKAGASMGVYGVVGVGFWRAVNRNTLVLLFEGDELSRETIVSEHSGSAAVLGAGVDVWTRRRIGFRGGYEYVRFDDGVVDEPAHNVRFMLLIGW